MNTVSNVITQLLVVLFLFVFDVAAKEADSLRLFHEPLAPNVIVDPPNKSPVLPEEVPRIIKNRVAIPSYQYNGFMWSEVGRHFIINGVNLSDIDNLALIAVIDTGRSLKLRTIKGYVFTLALGETVSVGADLKSRNGE